MKTILYEKHRQLGAHFVEFSNWEMPLYYTSIIEEHNHVRKHIGIFDVSHMGYIEVVGEDAEKFLDSISTNRIKKKKNNTATYTVLTNSSGGCVDDVIVYKIDSKNFFLIVNAGNRDKDLIHLISLQWQFNVSVIPKYDLKGILAIQGPGTLNFIQEFFPETVKLKPFHFTECFYKDFSCYISNTGYTGEEGVEIYASTEIIPEIWDLILSQSQKFNIQPIGLGARNTLRLEMGYALYSHELSESIFPSESVSAWTIKLQDHDFIGKEAIIKREFSLNKKYSYGIIMNDKAIAREEHPVIYQDEVIGTVTSGSYSPTIGKGIGLIMVSKKLIVGDEVEIEIRNKKSKAQIHSLPFIIKQGNSNEIY